MCGIYNNYHLVYCTLWIIENYTFCRHIYLIPVSVILWLWDDIMCMKEGYDDTENCKRAPSNELCEKLWEWCGIYTTELGKKDYVVVKPVVLHYFTGNNWYIFWKYVMSVML